MRDLSGILPYSVALSAARQVVSPKVGRLLREHYLRGRPVPFSVTLNVTTACNLCCAYCEIPNHPVEAPSTELLVGLARILGDHTYHWNLTGGEPLLRPDLDVIVDAIKDTAPPTYLTMFSNGALLRRRRHLVERVDEVFLSLDGSRTYHDRRRGEGAFDGAMEAMATLREMGKAYSATCVLTRESEPELDFLFDLAGRHGFKIGFIPVRGYPRAPEQIDALLPTPEQVRRMVERVRRFPLTSNSTTGLRWLARWPEMPRLRRPCKGGQTFFTLEADGRLYRCCERRPEHGLPEPLTPETTMESIRHMACEPCHGCWNIEGQEMHLMFSLAPEAIFNLARGAYRSHAMRCEAETRTH